MEVLFEAVELLVAEILQFNHLVVCALRVDNELVELHVEGAAVTVLGVGIKKTIRKVTIVVPVLITSCQVSEKLKRGPVTNQPRTTAKASRNAAGEPTRVEVLWASLRKTSFKADSPDAQQLRRTIVLHLTFLRLGRKRPHIGDLLQAPAIPDRKCAIALDS